MNLSLITNVIPAHFSPQSRVWVYAANRTLTEQETNLATERMKDFVSSWTAHGAPVQGIGTVIFNRFLVLAADETLTHVSGCSTDSSVRMMQTLQEELGVDLFNRTLLSFYQDDQLLSFPMATLSTAIAEGKINGDTLFFDHVVGTKQAFESGWLQPAKKSWLVNRFPELREQAIGYS
jgi:hypothetical protein